MNKVIIITILTLTGIFLVSECTSVSKFELHAKISDIAYANNISYADAQAYCGESLANGHDCLIIK